MLSLFSKEMFAYYIRCFIVDYFGYAPPPDPACPSVSKYVLHIHISYQRDTLGQGGTASAKRQWFVMLKRSFTFYENEDFRFLWSINCIDVCIHGYNCCQTCIDLSKCVYVASKGVKIEPTVGVQNLDCFNIHIWWSSLPKHWPQPKSILWKCNLNYAFVRQNLMMYTKN